MFLKILKIENGDSPIREIRFHKGINLIIDETQTTNKTESGNNVGKTTVLRLIDYCFGGSGENIYKDPEFTNKNSNTKIEDFLKNNNIIISLILKEDLEDASSKEISIRRNFLLRTQKIQEINGENYINNKEFSAKLKESIFNSKQQKPSIRQIVSKNIRDEKNKLTNTIKTLHYASNAEYEALYLFWFGIEFDNLEKKHKLTSDKKIEEKLQTRLAQTSHLSQIEQYLIIIERNIEDLIKKKNQFGLNENYEEELLSLNRVKSEINKLSTELSSLDFRRDLINQSKNDLESEFSNINNQQIQNLYKEAKALIPNIQKSFEDTLVFHNQMVNERKKYVTQELPDLEIKIVTIKRKLGEHLIKEKQLTEKIKKVGIKDGLQQIILELNKAHEQKGHLEEQKILWKSSNKKLKEIKEEIEKIDRTINSKDDFIAEKVETFNKYFSNISNRLYGEQLALSIPEEDGKKSYHNLNIGSISGNPGTGKKKGQIAAFDLAYIQFADIEKINCLHFILHDQIETVHGNQILNLLTEIGGSINCQYIAPVLKDKLPQDINVGQYKVLALSQSSKLFKVQ